MTQLPRATYALFVALLPAVAVVVGVIVLTQIPKPIEILAVGLVVTGVAIHQEPSTSPRIVDGNDATAGE